jgi:3-oxoacyl-[acyl-carrier protein] reductase
VTDNQAPVALITGASRGIGRSTAIRLARNGFDIGFCYAADTAAARKVMAEIEGAGRRVFARKADVAEAVQVRTFVDAAEDALGPVEALVCSAAVLRDGPLSLMSDDDWHTVLSTNVGGVFHACRAVVDGMLARGRGSIVTLSSLAGVRGNAGQTNYAASKAAIIGFTKSLAHEVGRSGVRANVVAPGFIATDKLLGLPASMMTAATGRIAARRLGEPEEIADVVAFLVSDQSSYLNGAVLHVDGGYQ